MESYEWDVFEEMKRVWERWKQREGREKVVAALCAGMCGAYAMAGLCWGQWALAAVGALGCAGWGLRAWEKHVQDKWWDGFGLDDEE